MTDTKWGEPIAVDGVKPEWLRGGEKFQWVDARENPDYDWWEGSHTQVDLDGNGFNPKAWGQIVTIRLPADHPYYRATSRGFTYWPGGDAAPADWDMTNSVILRNGQDDDDTMAGDWRHNFGSGDIIGYRRRAEPVTPADTVTIKRMTGREWNEYDKHGNMPGSYNWARDIGLIRRDPTPAERIAAETGVALADVEKVLAAQ